MPRKTAEKRTIEMIRAGFGSEDLEAVFPVKRPIRERCEVKTFYAESGRETALWAVLDFMDFDLPSVNGLKEAVVRAAGVEWKHVHILTTHNHGAVTCGEADREALARSVAAAAVSAKKNAAPAVVRSAFAEVREQVNYRRRIYIPELDGSATCFYGPCLGNGFDSSPFVEHFLHELSLGKTAYTGRMPTRRPVQKFERGDPTLFIMEFASASDGRPLGSFVRFAAHAVCCNQPGFYSSDYPWHVRKILSGRFGGITLFFNGPCAEIAPGIECKTSGGEQWLGRVLAETALSAVRNEPFEPLEIFEDRCRTVRLPVRPEVISGKVDLPAAGLPASLSERKRHLERIHFADTLEFLLEKYRSGEKTLSGTVEVELGLLRLNARKILAFPGETFSSTATAAGMEEEVATVTEHGRTVMYIPPREEYRRGGYESICAIVSPEAEEILRREAGRFLRE